MVNDSFPLLIITARIGSSRLPGKVLKPFWKDHCLLEFLIRRLQTRPETARLALAAVDTPENNPIAEIGRKCGIRVIRGPEDNVLARMNLCLEGEYARFVGRVTADNPFTDPELFALQFEEMKSVNADYSFCKSCPKGTAADIWTIECFKATVANATTSYELEHVNAWVWDHPDQYNIHWFKPPKHYINHNLNLSIDTDAEFDEVKKYALYLNDPLRACVKDFIVSTSGKYLHENSYS